MICLLDTEQNISICMMSYLPPKACFYLTPNRIAKLIHASWAEFENRKAKEARSKLKQAEKEKKARKYLCNITRMTHDMESFDTIESIYSFVMGMSSSKKGGDADQ